MVWVGVIGCGVVWCVELLWVGVVVWVGLVLGLVVWWVCVVVGWLVFFFVVLVDGMVLNRNNVVMVVVSVWVGCGIRSFCGI